MTKNFTNINFVLIQFYKSANTCMRSLLKSNIMKKNVFFLVAAIALTVSSCRKELATTDSNTSTLGEQCSIVKLQYCQEQDRILIMVL